MRTVKRLRNRRGQSVVEYLVVVAAVIAVILGVQASFSGSIQQIADDSQQKVQDQADAWANSAPE